MAKKGALDPKIDTGNYQEVARGGSDPRHFAKLWKFLDINPLGYPGWDGVERTTFGLLVDVICTPENESDLIRFIHIMFPGLWATKDSAASAWKPKVWTLLRLIYAELDNPRDSISHTISRGLLKVMDKIWESVDCIYQQPALREELPELFLKMAAEVFSGNTGVLKHVLSSSPEDYSPFLDNLCQWLIWGHIKPPKIDALGYLLSLYPEDGRWVDYTKDQNCKPANEPENGSLMDRVPFLLNHLVTFSNQKGGMTKVTLSQNQKTLQKIISKEEATRKSFLAASSLWEFMQLRSDEGDQHYQEMEKAARNAHALDEEAGFITEWKGLFEFQSIAASQTRT